MQPKRLYYKSYRISQNKLYEKHSDLALFYKENNQMFIFCNYCEPRNFINYPIPLNKDQLKQWKIFPYKFRLITKDQAMKELFLINI